MADAGRRLCRHHPSYVPGRLLERYHTAIEQVFGQGSCYVLRLREQGAVRVI